MLRRTQAANPPHYYGPEGLLSALNTPQAEP
jgi:hypothetical protein